MTTRASRKNLAPPAPLKAAPPRVTLVERPDPAPDRWAAAMRLLLEAGESAEEDRPA